jgi:hypothetical protein
MTNGIMENMYAALILQVLGFVLLLATNLFLHGKSAMVLRIIAQHMVELAKQAPPAVTDTPDEGVKGDGQ